jgi:hypothetical protein
MNEDSDLDGDDGGRVVSWVMSLILADAAGRTDLPTVAD